LRLLITGSAGYIGSVLCKVAQEKGHFVLGTDVNIPAHDYYDEFVHDSIVKNSVAYEASNLKVDAVFHLAASADVSHSTRRPSLYYNNNIGATSKLLDNLIMMGWKGPVIFSSTAAVYGTRATPCTEDLTPTPFTAYGRSKLMCEHLLKDVWNCNQIPSVSFRYFNVAGAYTDVGDHLESGHVIQKLCNSASTKEQFNIFGNRYQTIDGTCVRDYIHVLDVCEAQFTALNYLNSNPGAHIFNLGTKSGISVKQLYEKFCNITGEKIKAVYDIAREGDPDFLVADPTKFINATDFNYSHSNIEKIIDSAWKWYSNHRRNNNAV